MADRTRRARRGRRPRPGARSLAKSEAELPDDVRRRLHARATVHAGWVPTVPETAREDDVDAATSREETFDVNDAEPAREVDTAPRTARVRVAISDRVPVGLRGAVVAPSPRAVAGLAALLAAALALALALTWFQRPRESAVPAVRRAVPAGAVRTVSAAATPSPDVVVHLTGAVRRPGLVELPGGSRVDDAVAAAGGATRRADLASVNLARMLVDGEQIVVLRKGERGAPAVASGTSSAATASPGQPVDLNSATIEQLDGLPGVGPVLAQRIVDWRAAHGRFSSVDELTEVSGIGEQTLADLRPLVRV